MRPQPSKINKPERALTPRGLGLFRLSHESSMHFNLENLELKRGREEEIDVEKIKFTLDLVI